MIVCTQKAAVDVNAVTTIILNGLVREARNRFESSAYGDPARYQWGVYVSIQLSGRFIVNLGGTAEV